MGSSGQTGSDREADAFFAQFVDASAEVVAAAVAERGGDLAAVVAEQRAFGYWDRKITERTARKVRRDTAARMRQVAAAARFSRPVEAARRTPPAESANLLPERRVVSVTERERQETARWWAGLQADPHRSATARRLVREAREGEAAVRRAVARVRVRVEASRWRDEQRAFERAQWRAVLAMQADRRRRQVANRWAAISEQRALEIAAAALTRSTPPQARK